MKAEKVIGRNFILLLRCVLCEGQCEAGKLCCREVDSWTSVPHPSGEVDVLFFVFFFLVVPFLEVRRMITRSNSRVLIICNIPYIKDFYSHSNWVELGNTEPYSTLIRPDQLFKNLAGRLPLKGTLVSTKTLA